MNTAHTQKRRTLLLLILLLLTVGLFDVFLLTKQNESQTYRSKAAEIKKDLLPIGQASNEQSYVIDELFDLSDEDHAAILDEFVKVLAQNEKDLSKAGSQLSSTLGTDDYEGAYQALANLQKGLGDAEVNYSAAARLLDYHLVATPSATPAPSIDKLNKQVLGETTSGPNSVAELEQQAKVIEEGEIRQLTSIKTSIADGRKYLSDQFNKINKLITANNVSENQQFCFSKTIFLTDLGNHQATLTQNITDAKTKQAEAIKKLGDLAIAMISKVNLIDTSLKGQKISVRERLQLVKDKTALEVLRIKIADLQLIANDPSINNIALEQNDSTTAAAITTFVNMLCQEVEEGQARQTLNQISTDLETLTKDASLLQTTIISINTEITNIVARIPVFSQNDDKIAINFKLNTVSILLTQASAITSKITSAQATLEGLKRQFKTVKDTYTALQTKYQANTTLSADIKKIEGEISTVQTLLDSIEKRIQALSTDLEALINGLNQLSQRLGALFQAISEELKKPPEEKPSDNGQNKKQSTKNNDYCFRYDARKNDPDLRGFQVSCYDKLVGDSCDISGGGSGSEIPLGKKCVRIEYMKTPREVGDIPLRFFGFGLEKRDGSVCACRENSPNQKWVTIKSFIGSNDQNLLTIGASVITLYKRQSGGGSDSGGMSPDKGVGAGN